MEMQFEQGHRGKLDCEDTSHIQAQLLLQSTKDKTPTDNKMAVSNSNHGRNMTIKI